jgi:hypothetical protein
VCGIKKMAHRIHPQTPGTVNNNFDRILSLYK